MDELQREKNEIAKHNLKLKEELDDLSKLYENSELVN